MKVPPTIDDKCQSAIQVLETGWSYILFSFELTHTRIYAHKELLHFNKALLLFYRYYIFLFYIRFRSHALSLNSQFNSVEYMPGYL